MTQLSLSTVIVPTTPCPKLNLMHFLLANVCVWTIAYLHIHNSSNGKDLNSTNSTQTWTANFTKSGSLKFSTQVHTCPKVHCEQYSSSDSRSSIVAWVTLGWVFWWGFFCLQQSFLRADLSLDNMTCGFLTMFTEIQLYCCVDLSFISIWNTTMMMNRTKAMLT